MRKFSWPLAVSVFAFAWAVSVDRARALPDDYMSFSRFTYPEDLYHLLDALPNDVCGICEVAGQQTIHHLLLSYYDIPTDQWARMTRISPPRMSDLLSKSQDTQTLRLYTKRNPEQRIVGACLMESYFLAGLLRYKNIPVRIRAGFFKDIRNNGAHVVNFWEDVLRKKMRRNALLKAQPAAWSMQTNSYTRWQNAINHYVEHWICEYWDRDTNQWRLLDANNTFLKAYGNIDVGFHFPEEHFQYAYEAWYKMRSPSGFISSQYIEEPQDGRSHIRSQLLWDFYSLLNYDIAGLAEPTRDAMRFIRQRRYEELSAMELNELDLLAHLLAQDPDKDALVKFYHNSSTLRLSDAENDPYSFVTVP